VKIAIEELISECNCSIDLKHPEFLNLPAKVIDMSFYIEMTIIFKNIMKNEYFFGHKNKIHLFIENIFEKFEKEKKQIYKNEDVLEKMKANEFRDLKAKLEKINFKDYTCIGIFQNKFHGKVFDFLFFIKENKNQDYDYKMNLLQIKVSDKFKEDEKNIKYQVQYVKKKFEYLLSISISGTYLKYLSIYQKPKKFALNNKYKTFLYNIMEDKFVNFEKIEYKSFPFLDGALI
jgi:hypothetical protein